MVWGFRKDIGILRGHETEKGDFAPPYPINTSFPRKAKPYFRIRSSGIPFASRAAAYFMSSICARADYTVSSSVFSPSYIMARGFQQSFFQRSSCWFKLLRTLESGRIHIVKVHIKFRLNFKNKLNKLLDCDRIKESRFSIHYKHKFCILGCNLIKSENSCFDSNNLLKSDGKRRELPMCTRRKSGGR